MSLRKASDDVKSFVNKLKPLLELGEFLNNTADLEQLAGEAEQRKSIAVAAAEAAEKNLESKIAQLRVTQNNLVRAEQDAENVVLAAQNKASMLLSEASKKVEEIELEGRQKTKAAQEIVNSLNGEIDALVARKAEAIRELAFINEQISLTKSKILDLAKS